MRSLILPALKMTIAAIVTILITSALDLQYATTAGVIALLSIQSTKKESFKMAFKRIIISLIALALSGALFYAFGFYIIVFGVFLIIFIPLAYLVKMQEGLVVATVLVTHLLVEAKFSILLNEVLILIIPVMIALIVNLYMPNSEQKLMKKEAEIDKSISNILANIAKALQKELSWTILNEELDLAKEMVNKALEDASYYHNNLLFNNSEYHLNYLFMRNTQLEYLSRIAKYFERIIEVYPVSIDIARFVATLKNDIGYKDMATIRLEELKGMREDMKSLPLPKERTEFENRAMLYQILNELEEFLFVKIQFHQNNDHLYCKIRP
ncbi:MAG: aromatic acid exporter family protein [Bacilli bacterium]|jgi:uncharacterized membrane protein YgaE (UPF0421/DUF939 family)|nr:aromatic acid exporter family protein [Bacilli bacterium]HHU24506.1 aromatic acid exporter family protein [Acholeplasmataceae bacterium]